MTVSEFKAWLDGFSAAINGAPNQEQWETIKGKLSTIDNSGSWGIPKITPYPSPSAAPPPWGGYIQTSTIAATTAQ